MGVLITEDDDGEQDHYKYEDIQFHHTESDGTTVFAVDGLWAGEDGTVRSTFYIPADQIKRII